MSYTCRGFRFYGGRIGIKKANKLDLGLIACAEPANAAALFTRNRVVAAPVKLSKQTIKKAEGKVRAIVVNSGNANACTGPDGDAAAKHVQKITAEALETETGEILVASTGVIGVQMPTEKFDKGIDKAASSLSAKSFEDFATSILTTDKRTKIARRRLEIGGARVTLLGCTKGAGMIAPNMATTLSFVLTDAALPVDFLETALREASDQTFNRLTIDGDTSTNDMMLIMASGKARNRSPGASARSTFSKALRDLLEDLALKLMKDGEGVHHVVRVEVENAANEKAATQVARTIANSPLVKTAIAGSDPNWGRILAAAGRAGIPLNPQEMDLWVGNVQLAKAGGGIMTEKSEKKAISVMNQPEYTLRLSLNAGDAKAHFLTCDLSKEYVEINADYRT